MSTVAASSERKERATFRRILIATDFSEASRRTVAHAVVLARMYGSELLLVHALMPNTKRPTPLPPVLREFDTERAKADRELRHLAEETHLESYPHRRIVEEGVVWEALNTVIGREDVDLLVLGDHGSSGWKRLILGSVAEEVLRLAGCPTLTVGPHVPTPSAGPSAFRTILYVTDFGPASNRALGYALSLAEESQAKLVLLHMMEPASVLDIGPTAYGPGDYAAKEVVDWRAKAQEESLRKLKGLLPADLKLACEPQYVAERAFLPDGILAVAAGHSAELIVTGVNRGHSPRLASHMPGDFIHEVICRANCPVLTLRN
jgi:nucleotide-binding universal stress UspA family protein